MSIFIETQSLSVALTFSLHIKNIDLLWMFPLCVDFRQSLAVVHIHSFTYWKALTKFHINIQMNDVLIEIVSVVFPGMFDVIDMFWEKSNNILQLSKIWMIESKEKRHNFWTRKQEKGVNKEAFYCSQVNCCSTASNKKLFFCIFLCFAWPKQKPFYYYLLSLTNWVNVFFVNYVPSQFLCCLLQWTAARGEMGTAQLRNMFSF